MELADVYNLNAILARVYEVYGARAGDKPRIDLAVPQREADVKQLFELLHQDHALPGWFVESVNSKWNGRQVTNSAGQVTHEEGSVEVCFRYNRGPLSGIVISETGHGPNLKTAECRARVSLLERIAKEADNAVPLSRERLEQLFQRCVPTVDGVPITHDSFVLGQPLPDLAECATVDFKMSPPPKEVVGQVVGFLNGRDGYGLLVCGVEDATWKVVGTGIQVEHMRNAVDRRFADSNPPIQHGREYAIHELPLGGGKRIVIVEAHRIPSAGFLYKDNNNCCFVRRGPQTCTLTGKEVYHCEETDHRAGWRVYWK